MALQMNDQTVETMTLQMNDQTVEKNEEAGSDTSDSAASSDHFDDERTGPPVIQKQDSQLGTARTPWYFTCLILLSEIMGTGILGLPGATVDLGWAASIVSLVAFAGFAAYSGTILAEVRKDCPAITSFGDAAQILCGERFGAFTRTCVLVNWGATGIYFLIATANTLGTFFSSGPMSCAVVRSAIAGAILIVPAQCRDFHTISQFLSGPSTVCIVLSVIIIVTSLFQQEKDGDFKFGENTTLGPPPGTDAMTFLSSLGSFVFAYQGQSIFFELMTEMKDATQFPRTTLVAYAIMCFFYSLTAIVGYGVMGADVPGFLPDVLEDGWAKTVVGVFLLLHITVSYVVTVQPLHVWFHSEIFPKSLHQETITGAVHWALVSVGYILFAFVIGNLIPFFADIQELLGASLAAPFVFGYPPLFFILTMKKRAGGSWAGAFGMMGWGHCLLCFLGLVIFTPLFVVLGLWGAVRNIVNDVQSSPLPFSCQLEPTAE